ncbi:hypothetical protein ETAE_2542 [Edwardsiella piscicida]|uniref:Uncharacterized protein n=1 Tax=Edwardsiella piscicida TaxID=1263550 RepID=A0AAU8PR23_EDWPI|nr:hypothetical protein ETAE_2542 [Edwardsiella tarda EIB202]
MFPYVNRRAAATARNIAARRREKTHERMPLTIVVLSEGYPEKTPCAARAAAPG